MDNYKRLQTVLSVCLCVYSGVQCR